MTPTNHDPDDLTRRLRNQLQASSEGYGSLVLRQDGTPIALGWDSSYSRVDEVDDLLPVEVEIAPGGRDVVLVVLDEATQSDELGRRDLVSGEWRTRRAWEDLGVGAPDPGTVVLSDVDDTQAIVPANRRPGDGRRSWSIDLATGDVGSPIQGRATFVR